MKRPILVASDLRPCASVDETQRKNGNSTDGEKLDVILRAYRFAMILAEDNVDMMTTQPYDLSGFYCYI
ncbi:hypothetical protein BTO10_02630 [Vibrio chagasii]|uniref:Uncharacterized protein n=1 Tax=Vibrio chagasii TaxID=170679 RepID=A0A2S7VNQ1_9VIBR|nr:hypothetical protein BTO10_02630 [Vibrio chagasii]